MNPEEFRRAAHEMVDWIVDWRLDAENRRVRSGVAPGDVRGSFPPEPPDGTATFAQLMAEVEENIVPGLTDVQHPMNFGWFPANASLASVLGDLLSSGLGTLGLSWESSPALTEVEELTCDWMRQLVGLSGQWTGTIHDTASSACLVALLVARERATSLSQNEGGLQSLEAPLVLYTTSEAHSSVTKAALLAGFGWSNVRFVEIDPLTRAMRPDALAEAMADDAAGKRTPAAVVATVGTTGTTAIDPVDATVEVARGHGAFVHVDAAMAGSAMLLPEQRHLWSGIEGADSISWNPHKWMGTVLDTSLFYVRDVELLERVMSTNPSYLRTVTDGSVTQLRNRGIPLGRRFRALKLLFHLRLDGVEAIRERLRRDLDNARWLADQVEAAHDWEICAPVTLQTVCVRHRPSGLDGEDLDNHTLRWVREINDSGHAYLSAAELDGRWMARVSIGAELTERRHVADLWRLLRAAATAGPLT